jgi:hypothetical protein
MKRCVAKKIDVFSKNISLHYCEFGTASAKNKYYAAQPLVMSEVDEGSTMLPMVTLEPEVAQELIDSLWQCGLRPSEGSGSAGCLAATERHLKDMKAIAFHALKVNR